MKKILIGLTVLLTMFIICIISFGEISYNSNNNLENSTFYNSELEVYETILVDVWSIKNQTILYNKRELLDTLKKKGIKYITLSTVKDSLKLLNILDKNPELEKYDKSLENFKYLKEIFKFIKFNKDTNEFVSLDFKTTPYYAIIRNKKIIFSNSSDDYLSLENEIINFNFMD